MNEYGVQSCLETTGSKTNETMDVIFRTGLDFENVGNELKPVEITRRDPRLLSPESGHRK